VVVEDGPAAALVTLLLQTLGGGFAQRQVWFGAGLDVGRVRSVHGLVEGLGDGRATAGLQREHAQESGLDVAAGGPEGRACCRACRRYNRVAIEEAEEEEQERMINNSLPPPRHYFRGVAVRSGGAGLGVVVTREHSTLHDSTEQQRRTTARLHAWTVGAVLQLFAKARRREF